MNITNLITTAANVAPYTDKSSDHKRNAQENLKGRTHYAEEETLRFFHARILSSAADQNGLFFKMVESIALDYDNDRRGFRVVMFDLFGQVIYRPSIDECTSTSAAAENYFSKHHDTDTWKHYRAELKTRAARLAAQAAAFFSSFLAGL